MATVKIPASFTKCAVPFALLAILGGCGGGDGGGTASAPPASGSPPATTVEATALTITEDFFISAGAAARSFVTAFDEAAAALVRNSVEFKAQDLTVRLDSGRRISSFAFSNVRAEYPLSAGLTGAGQTIAIVDDGFRLSHDELTGKAVTSFGSFGIEGHGTAVAAIAAGKQDGKGMMGMAPGAGLHLSSFINSFKDIAAATNDARLKGAVVQNNSWGYKDIPITQIQASLAANPGWSAEQALAANRLGSSADMKAYLDALRAFTTNGVVVFAASNDFNATSSTVMESLPLIAPELGAGWLVAISAIPKFQDDRIVSAERRSAGCLQMAHTCLAATGIVYSATAKNDSDYGVWSGTSFAAPQISAGVALLAQAFPGLPANDIRRRLLASASNGFFAHSGYSDFGNGVVHGYNEEFGHGFMDLRAALLPIGATGLPATSSAYGGVIPLGSTYVTGGEAQGDAVVRALAKENIAIFDSLGADFQTPALALYAGNIRSTLAPRLQSFAAANAGRPASVKIASAGDLGSWALHAGEIGGVMHALGVSATDTTLTVAPGNLAGIARDALSFGFSRNLEGGSAVSVYGYSSARPESAGKASGLEKITPLQKDPLSSGGGIVLSHELGGATVRWGASFLSEADAALGMKSVGPSGSARGLSGAFDFSIAAPLPIPGVTFAISTQVGAGRATGDGLLRGMSDTLFSSFGMSLQKQSAFRNGDMLGLFVRQPLRMERGTAQLAVPGGRNESGDVLMRSLPVDLTPSARQIDLGFQYATPLGRGNRLTFGAAYAHNEGHARGGSGLSLMSAFQRAF